MNNIIDHIIRIKIFFLFFPFSVFNSNIVNNLFILCIQKPFIFSNQFQVYIFFKQIIKRIFLIGKHITHDVSAYVRMDLSKHYNFVNLRGLIFLQNLNFFLIKFPKLNKFDVIYLKVPIQTPWTYLSFVFRRIFFKIQVIFHLIQVIFQQKRGQKVTIN